MEYIQICRKVATEMPGRVQNEIRTANDYRKHPPFHPLAGHSQRGEGRDGQLVPIRGPAQLHIMDGIDPPNLRPEIVKLILKGIEHKDAANRFGPSVRSLFMELSGSMSYCAKQSPFLTLSTHC